MGYRITRQKAMLAWELSRVGSESDEEVDRLSQDGSQDSQEISEILDGLVNCKVSLQAYL